MNISEKKLENATMELQIEVPADKVDAEYVTVFENLQKKVKIDGFRKGKAPLNLVESRFIDEADKEVVEGLVRKMFLEAVTEKQYTPIAQPHYSVERQVKRGEPFSFSVHFEVPPTVVLGKYRDIAAEERSVTIKESDVADEITAIRERDAKISKKESGSVQNGDYVKIKVKRLDDPKQDKETPPSYKDYSIIVGKSKDSSSLDKYIVGMSIGEEREVDVKYPKDYSIKDLAGQKVTYQVRIEELSDFELPPLDDDYVKKHNFSSVQEMKEKITENINKYVAEKTRGEVKADILRKIVESSTYDIPESMIQTEMVNLFRKMQERFGYQIDSIEKFASIFGIDKDEFVNKLRSESSQSIQTSLALHEIAKAESITVSEERIAEVVRAIAERNNKTDEEVLQLLDQNEGRSRVENELIMDQTMDFIYDHAKVKKLKSISYEEFMKSIS